MQKSTIATLTVLILMTMTLSSTLVGMSLEKEPVRSLTEEDGVCTSDGDCPDGFICSSTGECVKPQTCDANGDCSDGQICQDGVCIDNPDQEDGNGCESNEDCTDGQYCDENGECADDPTQDDSCTSDADCADGQICGAAGECMDAPDDSGNETDGNETNGGGDEPQYRNCSVESGSVTMSIIRDLMICDDETGEWVELEDTRPTSVEIGCDEEPNEEQLNETNLADLLNEHDEILIRDGDDTIRMMSADGGRWSNNTMYGSGGSYLGIALCPSFNAVNDSNDCWVDFEITPQSQVFLIDIENNHSRTEMVVIKEENATHVSIHQSSHTDNMATIKDSGGLSVYGGASFSLGADIDLSMNDHGGGIVIMVGNGDVGDLDGYTSSSNNTETQGRSNSTRGEVSYEHQVLLSVYSGTSWNNSDDWWTLSAANGTGWVHYAVVREGEIGDVNGDGFDDIVLSVSGLWNWKINVVSDDSELAAQGASLNGSTVCCGAIYLHDFNRMVQIGMDENGNVTNANIVRSNTTGSGCYWVEDIDGENKDDGGESEDESSNVLVAAGGVEVTSRDAAVAGVGLLIGIGGSVITRWLRPRTERRIRRR